MKKQLFALPLIITGLFCFSCATTKPETDNTTEIQTEITKPETPVTCEYKIVSKSESTYFLDYEIQYPEFSNNPILKNEIDTNFLDSFKKITVNAKKEWDEENRMRKEEDPEFYHAPSAYEYVLSLDQVLESDEFLTLIFDEYTYLGGAHGYPMTRTINYSKKKNKILTISEAAGMSLEKVSRLCYDCLLSSMEEYDLNDIDWIQNGTEPVEENFEAFAITDEGKSLTVYFNPYQIAPYAWGILAVKIEL
ncbi:MAG: DUF3298 and DUF4163 domain-containing protein [Treponema sp.]|nr:DUF3298 and DUF4163 domain-containing protein [Treponema sp.]